MISRPISTEMPVQTVVFSLDGRRVLVAGASITHRGSVQQFGVETDQPVGVAIKVGGPVAVSAAYSLDGKRIVTTSYDRTARLWDADGC